MAITQTVNLEAQANGAAGGPELSIGDADGVTVDVEHSQSNAGDTGMTQTTFDVPKSNQTVLGLYVTPREAFDRWEADPDGVTILDVRTFEEYVFAGHPHMAVNVPLTFPKFARQPDAATAAPAPGDPPPGFRMEPNPSFIKTVASVCAPTDTIMVLCGSGGRAANAVNALAQAGFTNVHNIVNGFYGAMIIDPGDADVGKNANNGWVGEGLPWGRELKPELMLWENAKS